MAKVQKNVLKLSDSEIASIKIDQEKEAVAKSILEKLEQGEMDQPGMPGAGGDEEEDAAEDSNEDQDREDWTKDARPYDPMGTRELPGYPKDYSNNENGFVKLNGKEKEKVDILDRTISDIMQYNYESKGMLENLIKDKDKNKLDDSTLKGIISDI